MRVECIFLLHKIEIAIKWKAFYSVFENYLYLFCPCYVTRNTYTKIKHLKHTNTYIQKKT